MRFYRVARYKALPDLGPTLNHEDDSVIAEVDGVFDKLADRLSELYLVDSGDGPDNSPICMNRYVDPCRHHTVVTEEAAWDMDLMPEMLDLLQSLPEDWSFGIDASDFSPGQAHIMVTKSGDIFGWSEFGARKTLDRFGFSPVSGVLSYLVNYTRGSFQSFLLSRKVRRVTK